MSDLNKIDTNTPMKIYVAGAYTPTGVNLHDAARIAEINTRAAIHAGIEIIEKGHIPFIPHLTHYIHLETPKELSKQFYYEYDMAWLKCCDALFYLSPSEGADRERKWAEENGKFVFTTMNEIPNLYELEKDRQNTLARFSAYEDQTLSTSFD